MTTPVVEVVQSPTNVEIVSDSSALRTMVEVVPTAVPGVIEVVVPGQPGSPGRSIRPVGPYSPSTIYDANDLVTFNEQSYIARFDQITGTPPSGTSESSTEWLYVAGRGEQGAPGANGTNGINGLSATVAVGSTSTASPGAPAAVSNVGTSAAAVLNFSIPRGADGRGFVPRGAWTPGVGYNIDDLVVNDGSVYRVTTAHTAPASFTASNLELWASRGLQGLPGIPGQKGDTGSTGPAGRGFTPRGVYTLGIAYLVDDLVQFGGSLYRVTAAHTTSGVLSTTNLELWAQKGDPGTGGDGGSGLTPGTAPGQVPIWTGTSYEPGLITASTAAGIAFTPTAGISATNLQAALEEIDAEKGTGGGGTAGTDYIFDGGAPNTIYSDSDIFDGGTP